MLTQQVFTGTFGLLRWLLAVARRIERMEKLHRAGVWLVQIGIFALAGLAAFLLRFDLRIPADQLSHLAWGIPIWVVVKTGVFHLCGLHRGWWRFVSIHDVVRIGFGNVLGSCLSGALIVALAPAGFPRSLYLLDLMICFLGTTGVRVAIRMVAEAATQNQRVDACKRVLIYGAGTSGVILLRELRSDPSLPYIVCGFIDDDVRRKATWMQGVPVVGSGGDLEALARKHLIDEVLIAIPSATGPQMTRILHRCHEANVTCKTIPGMAEMIESNGLASQIRDVDVEDLLGRPPVRLDHEQIRNRIQEKVVLVTGAAGSIGSELCRQIARFGPSAIVGFEIAETALFHLEREMRRSFPEVPFYPEIGSIQDYHRIDEVVQHHCPAALYHAAAYKHVPMMEAHVLESIKNNIFGTYNVALAAARNRVRDFVMISTDKAVRPTSVMGATKRVAELLIRGLQEDGTKFVSVRFGNVLGSNGSAIPLFKEQIAAGGPVTVTHPQMRRYFMTIPEAAQLVLQASTMGKGGEIFVLDMGAPVKIVDLAKNLILLSGLRPDEDIKIEFTGIRPGEKLFEELNLAEEDTLPTPHEKIRIFSGDSVEPVGMAKHLDALRDICTAHDLGRLVVELKDVVPDYNPSADILRRLLQSRPRRTATATV